MFADATEMSLRAADATVVAIGDAVRAAGRCSLVLAGGSTPRMLYRFLASQFRAQVRWEHVHIFWGDERYVPADDPRSNYRMAKEALLDHVPCPAANVHPMPTHLASAELAALDYEATLKRFFKGDWPRFDVTLLGLGAEGHTASLFPGSPALAETKRWVMAVEAPAAPPQRLTLTLAAIIRSATVYFLVAGEDKAAALRQTLANSPDSRRTPAARVILRAGTVTWWADSKAGFQLIR